MGLEAQRAATIENINSTTQKGKKYTNVLQRQMKEHRHVI